MWGRGRALGWGSMRSFRSGEGISISRPWGIDA